ncbi:hypothetical protein LTR37_000604 [Vermiconidia calcicola]|uniref:Uncharacterized protein n=1 Tax=Vermiconidia calcicola TaxID=1690605 RepID=A0ACC3NY54_9PEZI|nr:hypothetical protein LTR37_000604 [Vermiconidia calcicola]
MGAQTIRSQTLGVSVGNPLSLHPDLGVFNDSEASISTPRESSLYLLQCRSSYIKHLLTHVNPYTGLSYAEDPIIFAYTTGNELSGPLFGDQDVPVEWTDEICKYVEELGPHKLCIDGTYGVNETHL